ncbi:MAG TPA: hypothetical protein VGE01_04165 [Fimbriimonas sp.]
MDAGILSCVLAALPSVGPQAAQQPESEIRLHVMDGWGRTVDERGVTLVDWEGHLANPAIKLKVLLPKDAPFPADVYLHGTSSRLHFNRYNGDDRSGVGRTIKLAQPTDSVEFWMSIFPDRDSKDEAHELVVQLFGPDRRERTRMRVPVRVVDQDPPRWKPLYDIVLEYRHDKTGFFRDREVRRVLRQAADDWGFFIDQKTDAVAAGSEPTELWNPDGFKSTFAVRNPRPYRGFLLYVTGLVHEENRAGGSPSLIGRPHTLGGAILPIRRSGSVEFDVTGNWNRLGWFLTRGDEDWWVSGQLRGEPSDLYSIALHEMGHALAFESTYPAVGRARAGEGLTSPALKAYHGFTPTFDPSHHFVSLIDPVSRYGGFGREYDGDMKARRWLLTKSHLLCLEAVGYRIRRTSAFDPLRVAAKPLVWKHGENAAGRVKADGGVPDYRFLVIQGALPEGAELDSFTGELSGRPTETGIFEPLVEVDDNDPTTPPQRTALSIRVD